MKTKPIALVLVAVTIATIVTQTGRGDSVSIALVTTAVAAQTLNPAYLSEMPTVERLKREIQGADPMDTAARQAGAFWQLRQIIYDMALAQRRDRNEVTPDEKRLADSYYAAHYYAQAPIEKSLSSADKPKWSNLINRYGSGPQFRDELFTRFFSAAFRAAYFRAIGKMDANVQERKDAEAREFKEAQAQAEVAAKQQDIKGRDEQEIARCIASGRNMLECIGETFNKGVSELFGAMNPAFKSKPQPPGLRMAGTYPSQGFSIAFFPGTDTLPGVAAVRCGELLVAEHAYAVQTKGNQVTVTVESEPAPFSFALRPDGKLAGPGLTAINGRVIVGSKTEQATEQKRITEVEAAGYSRIDVKRDASGLYVEERVTKSVPVTRPKTERCMIGVLTASGVVLPNLNPGHVLFSAGGVLDPQAKEFTKAKEFKVSPGLRVVGKYVGQSGVEIEFRGDSASVGCGQVLVAQSYAVENTGSQILVKIEDPTKPILLALRTDGTLAGPGPIQLNGRVITGVTSDSSNPVVYQQRTASCNIGILTPDQSAPTSEAAAGAAAAREAYSRPAQPNAAPAPARPNSTSPTSASGATGNAVLSVVAGFATQPGVANPLAGQNYFLLRESFETALTKGGFRPPPGMSAIKGFATACTTGQPSCQQAANAVSSYSVGYVRADANGKAQFQAVPAGAYYLFAVVRYNNQFVIWNLRVDLKGASSVTLDHRNATPIE